MGRQYPVYAMMMIAIVLFSSAQALGIGNVDYDAALRGRDSYSVIPKQTFVTIPDLADQVASSVQGAWVCEFTDDETLACGYEDFYAPSEGLYPGLTLFNVSNDNLELTDIIYVPAGTGLASAAVSANADHPVGAMSLYTPQPLPFPVPIILRPHVFEMPFYPFDLQTKTYSQVPSLVINILDVDPEAYTATISYTGIAGFSKSGVYVMLTYAVGAPTGAFPAEQIVGNRFAILELINDATDYIVHDIVDSPDSGKPGLYTFAQKAIGETQPNDDNVDDWIIAANNWNLSLPLGNSSQLLYYTFDKTTKTLTFKDQEWAPQYIQGVGYDSKNERAWIICNNAVEDGFSVDQDVRLPYENPAVEKGKNLRWHEIKRNQGTLKYDGGIDLKEDGIQVQPSRDGKRLFTTSASAIVNDVFPAAFNPLSPIGRRYAPNTVKSWIIKNNQDPILVASSAASPLAFALATNSDDTRLAVGGQDTYENVAGRSAGQRGMQLYSVDDDN